MHLCLCMLLLSLHRDEIVWNRCPGPPVLHHRWQSRIVTSVTSAVGAAMTFDPVKPRTRKWEPLRIDLLATALELLKASPVTTETCCVRSKNRGKLCLMIFRRSRRISICYKYWDNPSVRHSCYDRDASPRQLNCARLSRTRRRWRIRRISLPANAP